MNQPYTGGCACGAVRYTIDAEPLAMLDCQCRQCQYESGTGHSSHLTFASEAVEISGEVAVWQSRGDGGTLKERAICARCGCPMYMTFPDIPAYFVLRAGSLDQPERFTPQYVTWAAKGHPWDVHAVDMVKFDQMPPPT